MDITVNTKEFRAALKLATSVVDPKSTMPVLRTVVLKTLDSSVVQIVGTDLYTEVQAHVDATVRAQGACTVDPKMLDKLLGKNGETTLRVEGEGESRVLYVNAVKLRVFSADDFPRSLDNARNWQPWPDIDTAMLKKTAFARSSDQIRPHLCGFFVEHKDNVVAVVTTDGHRMCVARKYERGSTSSTLLLGLPEKLVAKMNGTLLVARDDGAGEDAPDWAKLTMGAHVIVHRQPDAKFPPYRQVLPENPTHKIVVKRSELLAALEAIKPFVNARESHGRIPWWVDNDGLHVYAQMPDVGEHEARVYVREKSIDSSCPEDLATFDVKIGMTYSYFVEALEALDVLADVTITFSTERNREKEIVVLSPIETYGGQFERAATSEVLVVTMPARI